jgi:hypothetical protein
MERRKAIKEAISMRVPLVQDQGEGYAVAELAGLGYLTSDAWYRLAITDFLRERTFRNSDGGTLRVLVLRDRSSLYQPETMTRLKTIARGGKVVIYGYSSTMRTLYLRAPQAMEKLGPLSAILDLDRLYGCLSNPAG